MAEYIERDAAMQTARHAWGKGLEPSQYIEIIPAADVVPVVRCKDCAYTREKDEYESVCLSDECVICVNSEYRWQPVWPNHFCGYGKRKDETQNER